MEDIPQPSSEPYSTGERVEVYVGPDDEDALFHGTVCEVVEVHEDDLLKFLDRVYKRIGMQEAWVSNSRLFFTPELESMILQRPDGYVMELSMDNPVNVFDRMRSARAVDVMYQMFEDPGVSA